MPAYAARQPPSKKGEDPVTVLVTGFGPFLSSFPINSSWEIASTLPALLPASPSNPTPIHIHVYHEPIRVAYNHVLSVLPTILPSGKPKGPPSPDIILHIGLAAGRKFFALEQGSHAKGYSRIPDVDGERFTDEDAAARFPATKFPSALETSFDTADVLERWRAGLGYNASDSSSGAADHPDVQISHDAGNFLCGFIYYSSLAHFHAINEKERPVAFMHVPDLSDSEEKMRGGRNVAIELIKALVESRRQCGVVDRNEKVKEKNDDANEAPTDNNFA